MMQPLFYVIITSRCWIDGAQEGVRFDVPAARQASISQLLGRPTLNDIIGPRRSQSMKDWVLIYKLPQLNADRPIPQSFGQISRPADLPRILRS